MIYEKTRAFSVLGRSLEIDTFTTVTISYFFDKSANYYALSSLIYVTEYILKSYFEDSWK